MKTRILIILPMLVVCLACGSQQKENSNNRNDGTYTDYQGNTGNFEESEARDIYDEDELDNEKPNSSNKSGGFINNLYGEQKLITYEFKDAHSGLTVQTVEYPSNWQVISKPTYTIDQKIPVFLIQILGPHQLKSFNTPINVYVAYRNPQTYQLMSQYGVPANMHRPLQSNEQIVDSEVRGRMEKSGFRYTGNIERPTAKRYLEQKIKETGGNFQMEITNTVWENENGQKALASVTKIYLQQTLSSIDEMIMWFYGVDYTFVDAPYFDQTLNQFENVLVSTKENPQWQQYVQQLNQQRMQIAQQQHQQRMRNNQAAFDAHQQKMKGIYAAQDANHAAFMNRNFGSGSDVGQQQTINMIHEEETVYNPLTGQNYQVEAGSTEYWMDSNGNYIQNNDLFYTPNGDINLNNREWVKVK